MTTIRDVAKYASVAPMTVSRVINQQGPVSPSTRKRVEEAIEALHYVPNRLGQGLRNKRTMVIALVVADISNPFAIKQVLGVDNAARVKGFNVIVTHTSGSPVEEMSHLRSLVERRVDGVVFSPVLNTPEATNFLQRQGLPVVVLDYPMPENDVDTVRCDSITAARALTEQLINLGHKRVTMLSGQETIVTARERAIGYSEAMVSAGLTPDVRFGTFSPSSGYQMASEVLSDPARPTALVTANNFIALGAARAAADSGLSIPKDLSISTFDSISTDIVLDPFFTGVIQPVETLASVATGMLLERVLGTYSGVGRDVVLPTEIEVRSSTGPPTP